MTVAALASTRTLVLAAYLLVLCGISVVADRRRRPAPTTRTRTFSTGSR